MLNFRTANIIFILIATVILLLGWNQYFCLLLLVFLYLVLITYGVLFVRSGIFIKTNCKKKTTDKITALTFDDGIHSDITPVILDILKERNIKAAFFVIGESVPDNHELLIRINDEGHILCNHSYYHSFKLLFKSSTSVRTELLIVNQEVKIATGKEMKYFRPPFGFLNPQIAKALRQLDYIVIGWSVRSLDTVRKPSTVMSRIKRRLHPGSIILFHDNRQNTADNLDSYITFIKSEGYTFERLDKFLGLNAYAK